MNLKKTIDEITSIRNEENNLSKFMRSLDLPPDHKILDVGCGVGAKLELLQSQGFRVTGVDINQAMVAANVAKGLPCLSVDAFNATADCYDVLLMSHVVEHFQPDVLLKFMNNYLDRLKTGGYLIITTPLASSSFFEDFDHVRPYHPNGIKMVFGDNGAQVQYYGQHKIELFDIWFRRGPFKLYFARGLYFKKYSSLPVKLNILSAILFRLSLGVIGRTDGWMGLYKKCPADTETAASSLVSS